MPLNPEDFREFWQFGFNVGAGVGISVWKDLEIVGTFAYHRLPFDDNEFLNEAGAIGVDIAIDGGAITLTALVARLKYNYPSEAWIQPYLLAGFGAHRRTFDDLDVDVLAGTDLQSFTSTGEDETAFGLDIGGGLGFPVLPGVQAFVEGGYTLVFMEDDQIRYFPFRFGVAVGL